MRPNTTRVICLLMMVFCAGLTGCGTIPNYEDIGNGYVEATYMRTSSWAPTAMRTELRYKKGIWTVTIWPSMYPVRSVVKDNVAIFVANVAFEPPYPGEPRATMERLFIVKSPALPLDITDEVLSRWSKEYAQTKIKPYTIVTPHENGNVVEFTFNAYIAGVEQGVVFPLDMNQITQIMSEVRDKGVVRKDRVWGTSYIEKEFSTNTNTTNQPSKN